MSDYLQALVGLTQGSGPRVRPVTRSNYEPPRPDISTIQEPMAALVTANNNAIPPGTTTKIATAPKAQTTAGKSTSFVETIRGSQKDSAATTHAPQEKDVPSSAIPLSSDSQVNPVSPMDPASMTKSTSIHRPSTTVAPEPRPALVRPPLTAPASSHQVQHPKPAPDAPTKKALSPAFRPKPLVRPAVTSTSPPASRHELVPQPPDIHVTIGRVDVRVGAAPERPTPRPKSAGPTLSLDDYLKARNGRNL
jgi:hypothetical protein